MGKFIKGQRVKITKGKQKIPQLNKYIGSESRVGRESREGRYYVRLKNLGIYEYFPQD
jgi:hypothetical protein